MPKFSISHLMLFAFLLFGLVISGAPPCPLQSKIGSIFSAKVTIAKSQALIPLIDNVDTQCYNYTLPYSFGSIPSVAIAVHDFESRSSNQLFFSIKPLQSQSTGIIPLLVRTQWRYTYWNKISFSFFAEDKTQIQAGYYEVDPGMLAGCEAGKQIQVLLPFRQAGLIGKKINHILFLHGFQVSSQKYDQQRYSPYQIQIVDSAVNNSGIAVLLSTTTITQVQSLHISYLAWSQTNLNIAYGKYQYQYQQTSNKVYPYSSKQLIHSPLSNIGRNYARIHGITGFIIQNNYQGIKFETSWTGTKFIFSSGDSVSHIKYLTYDYIFFQGVQCSDCPGYNFYHQERCLRSCPAGTYPTKENTCINCGPNYFYDGNSCVKLCPQGQVLNKIKNECECPDGTYWTGTICISCTQGRIFNNTTRSCQCPSDTKWNGFTCAKIERCLNGKQWNYFTFQCQCRVGTIWNGTFCSGRVRCSGGQIATSNNQCICPEGTYLKDGYCQQTGCFGGQIFKNGRCQCEDQYNWNGQFCLLCINGQQWNPISKACLCPSNTRWNGNFCQKFVTCTGGRIYFKDLDRCLCSQGQYWNGASCTVRPNCCCGKTWNETTFQCNCPTHFNWDGQSCVFCQNGKHWNQNSRTCECPSGTQWNGQFCAVIQNCFGGMIWNQNVWACQCPSTTVFNGNYCVANTCKGGQVWDQARRACICVGGKIFKDGFCINPETTCQYGKIWNINSRRCTCPNGRFDTGSSCETIKTCIGNQIYNPRNNKCQCPPNLVFLSARNICGDPTCPYDQRWDGFGCVQITCPPGSFYNGTQCICPDDSDKQCQPWELFDGEKCIYFQDTCPKGTRWNRKECEPINNCPSGFYGQDNYCKPFPQRCIPPTIWKNQKCSLTGSNCPYGSYLRGGSCLPQVSCQNGQKWDTNLLQCLCPQGTGWNGNQCVNCAGGQIWQPLRGCQCPDGHFFVGSKCEKADKTRCQNIPNSYWDSSVNICRCDPGFSVQGYQCVCKGIPFNNFCDRCAHKPNSQWKNEQCQCKSGYVQYRRQCLPQLNGNDTISDCNVGTYFDSQQKKCLACPDGCLSCDDCYTCKRCNADFRLDPVTQKCEQNCGDGKKYVDECDDNNNINGDGCSIDCKVQQGFICRGGSPNSADSCEIYRPQKVTLIQTGQIRYSTKISVNIKADYIPTQLLQSKDCNDGCSGVIQGNIISSDFDFQSITTKYISGSTYTFVLDIQFGRPYIPKFDIEIKINPALSRYFNGVNISDKLIVNVNPAFLSSAEKEKL